MAERKATDVPVADVIPLHGLRGIFKAVGGKRQLLPELRQHVPDRFGRYFEPFVGGGALFFDLAARGVARRAALNDLNPFMMATYMACRDDVEGLIKALQPYVKGYAGSETAREKFYYLSRESRPDPSRTIAAAAWFLFVNRTGFNGLYRVNKSGEFNTPHGKFKTHPTICNPGVLRSAAKVLRDVRLTTGDFEKPGSVDIRSGDFWYADPPYWPVSATSDFTAYAKEPFGPAEQERLRDLALRLKKKGVSVLLSNADVEPVRKLYSKGFCFRSVGARRAINSNTEKRGKVSELIIW
jgi:DNA adenine methylase